MRSRRPRPQPAPPCSLFGAPHIPRSDSLGGNDFESSCTLTSSTMVMAPSKENSARSHDHNSLRYSASKRPLRHSSLESCSQIRKQRRAAILRNPSPRFVEGCSPKTVGNSSQEDHRSVGQLGQAARLRCVRPYCDARGVCEADARPKLSPVANAPLVVCS
jgi:hypothetical protein